MLASPEKHRDQSSHSLISEQEKIARKKKNLTVKKTHMRIAVRRRRSPVIRLKRQRRPRKVPSLLDQSLLQDGLRSEGERQDKTGCGKDVSDV